MPPDGSKTSVPQIWDKPRVHGIRPEPVMACSIKKAKVDGDQSSKPIKSSLYEARMALTVNCLGDRCPSEAPGISRTVNCTPSIGALPL